MTIGDYELWEIICSVIGFAFAVGLFYLIFKYYKAIIDFLNRH